MRVLAVDPGLTSGYMVVHNDHVVRHGQLSPMDMCNVFESEAIMKAGGERAFVYERFQITPMTAKNSPQPTALEIIGVLKYFAYVYKIKVYEQTPTNAKRFSTNKKLKELGLYATGQEHCRDAARHYLLWRSKRHFYPKGVDFGVR